LIPAVCWLFSAKANNVKKMAARMSQTNVRIGQSVASNGAGRFYGR
jgi:hypothetical protein